MMKKILIITCASLFMATIAHAMMPKKEIMVRPPVKVVTTLAVIAAIVKDIGGDRVSVASLTAPAEDPHFVKAKPTFKRLVSDADLFMEIGRSLELWVPQVIAAAVNSKLSGRGLVSVSTGMKALEVPSELTRKKGDIHPQGNPHVWLSALGAVKMAENIKAALINVDGQHKDVYEKNFIAFKERLSKALFGEELIKTAGNADFLWRLHEGKKLKEYVMSKKKPLGGWLQMASSIDYPFMTYHTVWSYLVDEFDLKFFAAIEEKSGVAPTPKFLNELIARAKAAKVKHVFDARYYVGESRVIDLVAKEIGGKKIFIDADCQPGENFIGMMDRIFKELVAFKGAPAAAPAPATKEPSAPKRAPGKK
jgi:ABC-type Zn uptake system ZnuABC Zn-binding protein ZnuA